MHWLRLQNATGSRGLLIAIHAWKLWQGRAPLRRSFAACPAVFKEDPGIRAALPKSFKDGDLTSKKGSTIQRWIKEFPWSTTQQKADSEYPFLDAKEAADVRRMRAEINQLDGELRHMDQQLEDGSYLEPMVKQLPAEVQEDTRLRIAGVAKQIAEKEAQSERELQEFYTKIKIKLDVAPDKARYLRDLNTYLQKAVCKGDDRQIRMKLWQSYARCKAFLPPFLNRIPDDAWDVFLRISMRAQLNHDSHWASHRIILYEDMIATGRNVDSSQTLLYVEALNHEGRAEKAVVEWQNLRILVKDNKMSSAYYELIGVDLFTSQGNPQKAEQIAFEYLAKEPPEESRILIPILASWLERGDEVGWRHAWALYLQMKEQLGSDITMNDYDNVTMTFLNGGKTDMALAVFRDMMLTGHETGQGSLQLYRKAVGLMEKTQSKKITAEDFNAVALTSLTYVPRTHQNHFFYGSWLRKLISMGETDAAAQVIELMYERGVKPQSKHMNGIIGAWLRSETQENNDKAEKMAWAMVHERLDFVKKRGPSHLSKSLTTSSESLPFYNPVSRGPALATIETFCLLLNYYVQRRYDQNIEIVQRALEAAQIHPNSFFMNELLFHEALHGNLSIVWTKYLEDFAHIPPSLQTYMCLWDCEKKHLERVILKYPDEYPGPRLIMRETMNWFLAPTRTVWEQNVAREDFSKKMYYLILRCMCLAKDFEGVIIALYALRDTFGFYLDPDTARMITLDVARMNVGLTDAETAVWKPRRLERTRKNPVLRANVSKVDSLFEMLWKERKQLLLTELGIRESEITEQMQQEEGLFVMAEFLKHVLKRITPDLGDDGGAAVEQNLQKAAKSMGVGGICLDDPLPSYRKPDGEVKRIATASAGQNGTSS